MKPNKDWLEAYKNRVSEFDEAKMDKGAPTPLSRSPQNIYRQACDKVLDGYKPETIDILARLKREGKLDHPIYERYVKDILLAAGDVPTRGLFNRTQECGCYQCRGKK